LHPSFHKLGKVVFVFKNLQNPKAEKRRVMEKDSIPVEALLADVDLMRHLGMRAAAANSPRKVSRGSSSSGSSPLPSSPPTPASMTLTPSTSVNSRLRVTPGMSRVVTPTTDPAVVPARSLNTTNRLAPPVISDRDDPSDDEVEFIGFGHADGAIRPERPLRQVSQQNVNARLAVGGRLPVGGSVGGSHSSVVVASSITLIIVVWTRTAYKLQAVKLPLQSGQYMKLSMISKDLRNMCLDFIDIDADLDRYIPNKGQWALILMETLFKVQDGDVVNLKSSAVHDIPNFDIHVAHLP
ncbi:hypothetical protein FB446DRAFT_710020, partial [Lentinula raphanica]